MTIDSIKQRSVISDKGKRRITNSSSGFGDLLSVDSNATIVNNATVDSLLKTNPFITLQELDGYAADQKIMAEIGDSLLKHLKSIRFGLVNGELSKEHLIHLRAALDNNNHIKLHFPELQKVVDDIKIRAEVEIAKLSKN